MKKYRIIVIILLFLLGISLYFNFQYSNKTDEFTGDKTLACLELWEKKKERIFGDEIGNWRVIYNQKLDTCLAGNIYDEYMNTGLNKDNSLYFIFVIDLITDENLLSYQVRGDKMEDNGLTWDNAIKKYEDFGLRVW